MSDFRAASIWRLAALPGMALLATAAAAQELPASREGLASALAQYAAGADRDGDGRLDRAETAEALGYAGSLLTARRDPEPFVMDIAPDGRPRLSVNVNGPLSQGGMIDLAYRLADRDGDGLLSTAEVQAAGRAAFDAADRDRDGLLDEAERTAAIDKLQLFRGMFAAAR